MCFCMDVHLVGDFFLVPASTARMMAFSFVDDGIVEFKSPRESPCRGSTSDITRTRKKLCGSTRCPEKKTNSILPMLNDLVRS